MIELDADQKTPLYEQLYAALADEIRTGQRAPGTPLPGRRTMAAQQGVSVNTVDAAYQMLAAEGLAEPRPRSGFYVQKTYGMLHSRARRAPAAPAPQPPAAPQPVYDLSTGSVDTALFPARSWGRIQKELLYQRPELLQRGEMQGDAPLRTQIAEYLSVYRGVECTPEQIVVGAGTEYLYNLIVQLLGREAVYGVEDPGYSKAARIYALGGARTSPVLVDEGGVSLRSLEMSGAQILHTSPNHQFPTGAVTPIGRRQSLLRWAEAREGRYIIEDDYDSEFRFTLRPIPTLQSIDRAGRVIYVNTFSRTLAPSLRISYMVLPKSLTERYRAQLGFYSSTVPAMEQHTLARFLDEGYFEAHINRMRKSYRAQRDAVIDTILQSPLGEHCRVSGEDAGLHFLLTIDTKCTDHVLRADAEGRGVRLSFLSDFALRPGSAPQHTLVIHYPGIDLGRLRSALSILEALLYFRDWKYKGRK